MAIAGSRCGSTGVKRGAESGAGSLASVTLLLEGITFSESRRWHDGRLWFSDWGAHQVIALDPHGGHEVVVFPAPAPGAGKP